MSRHKIGMAVVILLVAALGICIAVVRGARTRAQGFLTAYRELVVGTTRYDNATQQLESYRAILKPTSNCTQEHCEVNFMIQNSLLSVLHLAPPTGLTGTLYFRNRTLVAKYVYFGQGTCCVVRVAEFPRINMKSSEGLDVWVEADDHGSPMKVFFTLAADATSEQANYAYDFNLTCLSKLGGCNSANALHTLRSYRVSGLEPGGPTIEWDPQESGRDDIRFTIIVGVIFAAALAITVPLVHKFRRNSKAKSLILP